MYLGTYKNQIFFFFFFFLIKKILLINKNINIKESEY